MALLPMLGLIGGGFAMKTRTFLTPEFWPQAEKLCYFVLLPALFINGTATTELADLPIGTMAPVLAGSVIVTALALALVQRRFRFDGPAVTSVVQGSIRFNNYLGLSIAVILYGEQGVALAAITNAILVPLVNVLCTIVFARHARNPLSATGTFRSICTNPLILACAAGIVLNLTGVGLPVGIAELVRALGSASLPLGLLCVGAGLQVNNIGRNVLPIAYASAIKFLVLPAIAVAGCLLLGLAGPPAGIVVLFLALPTASSAYVMAKALGGDSSLMASTITLQTITGVFYLPGLLFLITSFTA
ncbi:AEC family transporter [Arthrobacter sp. R1-13]